jgi:hypothetical protein
MGQSKIHTFLQNKWKKTNRQKHITTCTLVLLKFRLELWPMRTYFRNSNDCFIKLQTVGKSSNWGFRICWICILGWSVLKLGITLWKASIKLSLNILFELQCREKWCSLSITLQLSHNICSFGIFLYLPISIFKLWSHMRNFVRSCLFLKLVSFSKYSSNFIWVFNWLYKKSLESLFIFDHFCNVLLVYFSDTVFLNLNFKDYNFVKRSIKIFIFTWIHFTLIKDF